MRLTYFAHEGEADSVAHTASDNAPVLIVITLVAIILVVIAARILGAASREEDK